MSVFAEAAFYRVVVERIHERVGRYLFFMLLFSAGMWSASTGSFKLQLNVKQSNA